MFEEKQEIYLLFEFYGDLLTEKQRIIFDCYYKFDIGLTEIAEQLNITKQAVKDSLEKSKLNLLFYEQNLHLTEKYKKYQSLKNQKNNLDKELYILELENLMEV